MLQHNPWYNSGQIRHVFDFLAALQGFQEPWNTAFSTLLLIAHNCKCLPFGAGFAAGLGMVWDSRSVVQGCSVKQSDVISRTNCHSVTQRRLASTIGTTFLTTKIIVRKTMITGSPCSGKVVLVQNGGGGGVRMFGPLDFPRQGHYFLRFEICTRKLEFLAQPDRFVFLADCFTLVS